MPPPQHAKPARKAARCGVGDGSPRPHPPHPQPVGSGPLMHAPKDEWLRLGERLTLDAPGQGKRRPPRAPSCLPHSAKSQLARACVGGLMTGPNARIPRIHCQWVVGFGRTPERTSSWWVRERPTPDTTHAGKRHPRWAPSCRPHSTRSQLASARAVGLVTGPHARTLPTHSQWVVGPGHTPERTGGRGWESARPRTPHTQARGAPPQAPSCRCHSAQSQLVRARVVGLVTGPHACSPGTHSQWVVGPSSTLQRTSGRGWESARHRTPTPSQEAFTPGALVPLPQRAKPACKSALWGR